MLPHDKCLNDRAIATGNRVILNSLRGAPPPLCTPPARNEKTAWRSHDVTAYRRGLAVGGGSALAALPSCTALPAMGLGDS